MKRIQLTIYLLFACCLLLGNGGFAQKKGFVIQGKVTGLKEGTKISLLTAKESKEVYLLPNEVKDTTVAEVAAKDGAFKFEGYIPNPAKVYKVNIEGQDKPLILVMINEVVTIKGDLLDWPRIEVLNCTYFPERRLMERELGLLRNKLTGKNSMNVAGGNPELNAANKKFITEFAGTRSNSPYIPYLILLHGFSAGEKQAFYNKFTSGVKKSYYGLKLKEQIGFLKELEKIKENAVIPNFNLITADGTKVSILELAKRSDYTLLYFWFKDGSPAWGDDLPVFKKMAEKFRENGVNLVNLNIDRNAEDWKTGMKEFDSPGLHARFEIIRSEKLLFDLRYTAAYILIDKQGKLISFDLDGSRTKDFGPDLNVRVLSKTIDQLPKKQTK